MVRFDLPSIGALVSKSQPQYEGSKGSVVRLYVRDFMTYHTAELRPGAHVNLILGPNGTGKSTIVCGICLGLAGKPKILGRAIALKEYIRHGAKSATIEIELYNPHGLNFVIKRNIKEASSGNVTTQWYLKGKPASQAQVEELTSSLNIQLDNLCQFLPQDRVQDFVGMDSFTLLQNTQKALGNDTLSLKHEKLLTLTGTQQEVERHLKAHTNSLKTAQQYTKRLEKDVENFRERESLKLKIAELTSKLAWIAYTESRDVFSNLKTQLETIKQSKTAEEAKLSPLKKSLHYLETILAKYTVDLNRLRSGNVALVNALKKKVEEEFDKAEANINEEQARFSEQERSERERQNRVGNANLRIKSLEKQLEELRLKGDMDDVKLNREVAELENVTRNLDEKILEINGQDEKDETDRRYFQNRISRAEIDLSRIDDLRVSRMKYLEREQKDVYDMVQFFSKPENRTRFKGRIHEPMVLHVYINDLKYGRVVERHISPIELNGFFCEDKDDVEVMMQICEERKKRISVSHYEGPSTSSFKKPTNPFPPDFMEKWGFVKVVFDIIEGPDYYLGYLQHRFNALDRTLIGNDRTLSLAEEIGKKTKVTLFYTETNSYTIRKSHYSNSTIAIYKELPAARIMTTEINAAEKQRLHDDVVQWKSEEKKLQTRIKGRAGKKTELEEERQSAEDKIRDINARIEFRKGIQQRLEVTRKQIAGLEREVNDLASLKKSSDNAILKHRLELLKMSDFIAREITKIQKNGAKPIILRRQISRIQSRIISRKNELGQMQGEVKECEARIKALTPEVEKAAKEAEGLKKDAINKSNNVQEPPADVLAGNINKKEVEKDLNQANVQLLFLMETDESIVKDYQEKMRQISELQRDKDNGEKRLSNIKDEIEREKAAWLTPLTELIGTVNKNFGRFFASMGCAGVVELHKGADENDFSKYGITIRVKFRSSEPLSELGGGKGGTLQSGGERVISTALYILALQELTTVPFRVIDEINQGMDSTNEARFFNLLCTLAKGPNTPQYFLLTPKMLPRVEYPDNVDFHIIMSGPHVNVPQLGYSNVGEVEEEED